MVPLGIHTENTLLNSLIRIPELVQYAKEKHLSSLTITDKTMYGVIDFYLQCKKEKIHPIIGLDIMGIILYAKNYQGYQNLLKLSSIPNPTLESLKTYSSSLICIVPFKNRENKDQFSFYETLYQGYTSFEERNQLKGENLLYYQDVYYILKQDKSYLKYLLAIQKGCKASDISILEEHDLESYQAYSIDQKNNLEIEVMCQVDIPMHQDLLPLYPCPDGVDSYTYLKQLVKNGLKKKFGQTVSKVYIDRLKYELDVIHKMGFCNYFLVVWDYVKYAKEHDILVGPGRGSAAGSLVSYCLDITTIDPIRYQLLFERFLNPERISMPDIDIDFEDVNREKMIQYCIQKYGLKKVAPILTFGTLGSKQVIRDIGKSMGIVSYEIDKISKQIDPKLSLLENYHQNSKLKELLISEEMKKLYKVAMKLEGLKRHTSIHAAGVVMCQKDLDEVIPLLYHDTMYITGYSMEHLEELGLLKMDFLALRNLTFLHNILKEIHLSLEDIPLQDKEALAIFTNVDTVGIFQFESNGMKNFLRKFKPETFEDIVACLALFRPGPMQNIDTYIRRKNGKEKIDTIDDTLKPILSPTYGIIVYQEQIMQIAHIMARYTFAQADLLRKAMSKKKEDILLKEKDKFIKQSIENGYSKEKATQVYDLILKFASYGFNRAHSVSYAMIAYKMAYLKAHYKDVFTKHLLSMVIGSEVKTKEYIENSHLEIKKPSIHESGLDYVIQNHQIIYPLTNIKNVGKIAAQAIVDERKKGNFKDIFDFFARCYGKEVNSKVVDSLIKAGCFDCFHITQKTIDSNLDVLTNYSELGELLDENLKPELKMQEEYSHHELMMRELEAFGTYLSHHPVTIFRSSYKTILLKDLPSFFNQRISCLLLVERVKKITTKKGQPMVFITGSDESGSADFVLFPSLYQDIALGSIFLVNGRVERRFDKYQVIINQFQTLDV